MKGDDIAKRLYEAKEFYYNNEPIISDAEFDALEEELKLINPDHEYFAVVGAPSNYGKKIKHTIGMLSMGKSKDIQGVVKWMERLALSDENAYLIEPKIDGLSCDLKYIDGKLIHVATRGDGVEGQDVSHIARYMTDIPSDIDLKGEIHLRGELYLPKTTDFPNPDDKPLRNMAVGLINRKDKNLGDLKYLRFVGYQLLGSQTEKAESEKLDNLEKMLPNVVVRKKVCTAAELEEFYNNYLDTYRVEWEYETDGLTITVDDITLHEEIDGRWVVDHHHHYQLAWKPPAVAKETVLLNIEWNLSKHGSLVPVAIFEPVVIGGAKIERAALNNAERIENTGLRIGDTLMVERANDVIPFVLSNELTDNSEEPYKLPVNCPSCNDTLTREGVHLRCKNHDCPEKQVQKLIFWVRQCDIEGVSEQTVRRLWEEGIIKSIKDLYLVEKEQLESLEGFAEKSAGNAVTAIHDAKSMTPREFIKRLGIESVGERALVKLNVQTIDDFLAFNNDEYVTGQRVIEWKKNPGNMEIFEELIKVVDIVEAEESESKGKVCMTGKGPKGRKELIAAIEAQGYQFIDSITKDTDILICEDVAGGSSKLEKARKQGITLVSYEDFFKNS
ncbi:MAG: hypothetical protein GY754_43030 [bacterium]|nr:hypothetical protein [bacterium]